MYLYIYGFVPYSFVWITLWIKSDVFTSVTVLATLPVPRQWINCKTKQKDINFLTAKIVWSYFNEIESEKGRNYIIVWD